VRIGSKTDLKTDSFAVFESSSSVTTEAQTINCRVRTDMPLDTHTLCC